MEPLGLLRQEGARPARLPAPPPLRVLGPRRVPGADLPLALVAPGHARLPRPPHRLVRVAQAEPAGPPGRHGGGPGQPADGGRPPPAPAAARPPGPGELGARPPPPPLPPVDWRPRPP